jgi:3-hydroxybutyryl-CoA dehydrogenase
MAEIRTIAVIGAGAVGRGIAFAAALGGYRTILEDILPSSLRTAAAELREHLSRAADLGTVSKPEALVLSIVWNMHRRWNTPRARPIW